MLLVERRALRSFGLIDVAGIGPAWRLKLFQRLLDQVQVLNIYSAIKKIGRGSLQRDRRIHAESFGNVST
jgi:hypothetical protein